MERKRRDHIKDSFSGLRDSIPSLQGEKVAKFSDSRFRHISPKAFNKPAWNSQVAIWIPTRRTLRNLHMKKLLSCFYCYLIRKRSVWLLTSIRAFNIPDFHGKISFHGSACLSTLSFLVAALGNSENFSFVTTATFIWNNFCAVRCM